MKTTIRESMNDANFTDHLEIVSAQMTDLVNYVDKNQNSTKTHKDKES